LTIATAGDRGSGSVLGIAVLAAVVGITLVVLPLYGAFAARQAVSGAADAAALAAADTRAGVVSGYPCELAQAIAELNATRLVNCELDGLVATVAVSRMILGIDVVVFATAGPPAFEGQIR
jgi:secretion/DNA translocation related TadE-like protein